MYIDYPTIYAQVFRVVSSSQAMQNKYRTHFIHYLTTQSIPMQKKNLEQNLKGGYS